MSSIIILAKSQNTPSVFNQIGVFAYKEGRSCLDVLLPLQLLLEAGFEWRREMLVCVASADVLTAFDSLTVQQAWEDMVASGLHPQLVAAIAEENCDLRLWPTFPQCSEVESMPFNKSIRQGGMESPFCWNRSIEQTLAILVPDWSRRCLGISLDGICGTHAVWADNFYLLSSAPVNLQIVFSELSDALARKHLR